MSLDQLERRVPLDGEFNWVTGSVMAFFHAGAIAAFFYFSWSAVLLAAFLWWVSGSLGIGMGYHRLLTHRGYKTPKWVEYFLTICSTLTMEGGPIYWVATHRIHHQFSDKPGDPHSPNDGYWWSHMGWIVFGKTLHNDTSTLARYVPDLAKDKFYIWLTKYHYVPTLILSVAVYAWGGMPFLLWGMFFRVTFGLHATWLVNSASHIWGPRRFDSHDRSTNNWWVALLAFGEGWHNNHHAHPTSSRHGLVWWEIDMNWYGIWALSKLGLASDIYYLKLDSLDAKNKRAAASDNAVLPASRSAQIPGQIAMPSTVSAYASQPPSQPMQ